MSDGVCPAWDCSCHLSSWEVSSLDCEACLPSGPTQIILAHSSWNRGLSLSVDATLLAAAQVTSRITPVHPELRKQTLGCFLCCVVSSGCWETMAQVSSDRSTLRGGL